jgi:hypothetical protein
MSSPRRFAIASCVALASLSGCGEHPRDAPGRAVLERECGARGVGAGEIVEEVPLPRPEIGQTLVDPGLGGCVTRASDHVEAAQLDASHAGSPRQAWNADGSLLVLRGGRVVDAHLFETVAVFEGRAAFVWARRAAHTLYAVRDRHVEQIDVRTGRVTSREVLELERIDAKASFHDVTDDGRFTVLAGPDQRGGYTLLLYDIVAGSVSSRWQVPLDSVGAPRVPRSVRASPSGEYVVSTWSTRGGARFEGVEQLDREFRFVRKVTGGLGHGDLLRDGAGDEWYVDFAPDAAHESAFVVKHALSGQGGSAPLLRVPWSDSVFVSCRASRRDFCALSSYATRRDDPHPLKDELFLVALDSAPERPNILRLAHHRSDAARVAHHAACPLGTSAALPELSLDPRGRKIVFTSNWEGHCFAESYVLVP